MAGDDDDDLRINTLHRFAKHSPRLVLHEYSHCEVPAGCGGVVLRWVDVTKGSPAMVRLVASGVEATCWLDGEPLASNLALLRAGGRLLAVHLRREQPEAKPFAITVRHDDVINTTLVQLGRPRWRCTATAPGSEGRWTAPDFDDDAWPGVPLASAELIAAQEDSLRRGFESLAEAGVSVFVLDTDELWLRCAFTAPEAT